MTFYTKVCTQTPRELKVREQWVVWRWERRNGQWTKVPYDPRTGKHASHSDPATWCLLAEALEAYESGNYDGLGFVFTKEDPFAGVDLDKVRDPESGAIAEWALEWVEEFGGYCEVSPSGKGLHIFIRGRAPNRKNQKTGVEAYSSLRFFTFTADIVKECNELPERQDVLDRFSTKYFPARKQEPTEERRGAHVDLEDRELLEKARTARGEVGERFTALYDRGDFLDHASHSEARLELLKHLAFWTAWDAQRMSRVYEGSALYQMPGYARKWARLGERECERAIAGTPRAYRQQARLNKDEGGKDLASNIAALRAQAESTAWEGRGGPTDKHIYGTLLDTAAVYGTVVKRGILVSADTRNLALAAGVGLGTVSRSLKRLREERNLIRLSKKSTRMKAHVYLLKHPEKRTSVSGTQTKCVDYVPPTELLCRQLRNRGPSTESEFDKDGRKRSVGSRHLLSRLGKHAALILEYVALHVGEGGLTLKEIARGLGRKPQNVANSKAFARLLDSGLLVADGERFNVPADLEWRLGVELEESGCNEARRLDGERYDRERKAFRTRHARKADEGPSEEDMHKDRLRRIQDALDVLQTRGTGPQMILQSYLAGETKIFEYVVNAVAHYFGSVETEMWRGPVGEAVALIGGG